jgi:thiamine-phosphate pyrophosphorylase
MSTTAGRPIIYMITQGVVDDAGFSSGKAAILDLIKVAVGAKVSIVQIREKQLNTRNLFDLTAAAADLIHGTSTLLLVNDRSDVAAAAGAHGVHLTTRSIPAEIVRTLFSKQFVISVSTHTIEEARAAEKGGADLILFGPVFTTPGKGSPQGLETLSSVCQEVHLPVIALGGIDAGNCRSALNSGAGGAASIRSFKDAASISSFCSAMRGRDEKYDA